MSNTMYNELIFPNTVGSAATLEKYRIEGGCFGSIDFNMLIPQPEELGIRTSVLTDEKLRRYAEFIKKAYNDKGLTLSEKEEKYRKEHGFDSNEDWNLGKQAFANIANYGYPTWYEWRIANWGAKWQGDEYSLMEDADFYIITFLTPNFSVIPIITELSKKLADIEVEYRYADADNIGSDCGEYHFVNGETVWAETFADDKDGARNFACELIGIDHDEDDDGDKDVLDYGDDGYDGDDEKDLVGDVEYVDY